MRKSLLTASSNLVSLQKRFFSPILLLVLTFWMGSLQTATAQFGVYQNFESIKLDKTSMQAAGWSFGSTSGDGNFDVFTNNAGGGITKTSVFYLAQSVSGSAPTAAGGYVDTPTIADPSEFSFWYRSTGSSAANMFIDIQINDGTNGWESLLNATIQGYYGATYTDGGVISRTTYKQRKFTFTGTTTNGRSISNVKFRVIDTRTTVSTSLNLLLDDFLWKSRTAASNSVYIPALGNPTTSSLSMNVGDIITLYDNGGVSDYYMHNQDNTMTFTASAGNKIEITFNAFKSVASEDYIFVHDAATATGNNMITGNATGFSGTSLPTTITYTSTGTPLTIRFTSNNVSTTTNDGYDITVKCISGASCTVPSSLAFSGSGSVSHNQAYLTWTASPSVGCTYDVYYATSSTPAPTSGTTPNGGNVSTTTATVTGLSASTQYYFWVRANCGATQSAWIGPINATTLCAPQSVTYLETFNGLLAGALPTCTSATASSWQSNSVNGNLFCNGVGQSFFTQGVTLTSGQLYRLTYDYSSNLNGTADMQVFYGNPTNNVAPTVSNVNSLLATHTFASGVTTNILNFVAPSSGTFYIRFLLTGLSNVGAGALNLDNVKLEIETCLAPTFPGSPVSGVNDFGATVSWNVPSTGTPSNGYYYYLSTSSTPPGYYDTETGSVSTTGVTLSSLSSNTTYYVWVRSNCGGQISTWSSSYASFTTTNTSVPTVIKISDTSGPYTVACGGTTNITFTDSGGTGSNYSNNEKTFAYPSTSTPYSYTFKTDGTLGARIMVVFNTFTLENGWDGLMIYSGLDSTTGTLMSSGRTANHPLACPTGAWTGTTSPGTIISTATDGSLTFEFRSDDSVVYSGWTATIKCVSAPPVIDSFTPNNNNCGQTSPAVSVVITGSGFTGVTGVYFNGVLASYVVNSSTQITATLPSGASTGKIKVTTSSLSATSSADFSVNAAPPTTSGAVLCTGGSGDISSSVVCDAFLSTANITGSLTGSSSTSTRPFSGSTCSMSTTSAYYNAVQIMVSVSGSYTFETTDGGIDFFAYITGSTFTPGVCGSGTFVAADDDSGAGLQPRLVVNLTAGVVYTLYLTTFSSGVTGSYTWNFITPVGGSVLTYQNAPISWYTVASGGTPIGSGSPFNPVGVAGSGLTNTLTPGTYNFYGACSSNSGCRTLTTFVIGTAVGGTVSSSQNICGGSFADLVLSGSAGTVTKWQYASDSAFTTGLTDIPSSASTTLTSAQIGSFVGTRYYRAVVTVGACTTAYSTTATLTYSKVIWDGSVWSNGTGPDSSMAVEFQGDFVSSANAPGPSHDLSACSVFITSGADVLFDVGTLSVQNEVNVSSGFLTIEDNASLYQAQTVVNAPGVYSGGNSGSITSRRVAEPMFKFDYTYWSTPVNPQNLLAVSPGSPQDWFLIYNAAGNAWQFVTSPSTTTMTVGKGYLIRAPLSYPVGPLPGPNSYTASFSGVPNNGTFTIPIVGGASQMNLLGNPYPSALYAPDFINGNTNVNGTLYFWTHNTALNPVTLQYTANDYAIYNLVGGTATAPTNGAGTSDITAPLGYIASGQGFFVKGLSNGTATFSNSMRRAGNNTQFYKSGGHHQSDSIERHRYWLNIANETGAFKQILIGYVEGATTGLDRMFDGDMVDVGNTVTMYTKVEDTKLSIQGRPLPFDVNETIPLCYKSTVNGNYTINMSLYDGLFDTQHVYLEDKLLNVIHDLRVSPYTFATLIGTFEDRFELRYTDTALGTTDPVFDENSVIVYKNNQGLYIDTGAMNMSAVTIFDIRGRILATQKQVDRTTTVFNTLPTTNQVLLVRIEAENGAVVTKKVVY